MYEIRAKFYENVNAGDIVYIRRNGAIVAARVEKYRVSVDGATAYTTIILNRADGFDNERLTVERTSESNIYATIEDAIYNRPIAVVHTTINDIYRDLDFVEKTDRFRATRLAKIMYKWDGYNAVKVAVYANAYYLVFDNEGCHVEYKYNSEDRLYESREECMKNNAAKVITF